MNTLVTVGDGEFRKLVIPQGLVKKWRTDEDFGDAFGTWLDTFCEKYSIAEDADTQDKPNKRAIEDGGSSSEPGPSPKKVKIEEVAAEFILANDKVAETLLLEAKLSGKDSLSFQIRTGHQLYLVNNTGQEISLKPTTPLVGFGRGTFKLLKENETLPEKAIVFDVTVPDALLSLNGVVSTVSELVAKQRESKPEAQVSYHKATMIAEKPGQFEFKMTHKVAFIPPPRMRQMRKQARGKKSRSLLPTSPHESLPAHTLACIRSPLCGTRNGRSRGCSRSSPSST